MKRIIALLLATTMLLACLTACDTENPTGDFESSADNTTDYSLVDNPTEAYIIACLEETPNITGVAAVTEDNDPNGDLNKDDGYYSAVYFSADLIEQEGVFGEDLIDKGTDAGGCIEAYKSSEKANARNDYLTKYDDSWLFNAGYHTVVGTLVIRTSIELSEEDQALLATNIINVLIGGEVEEPIESKPSKDEEKTESKEETKKPSGKIKMPKNTEDYIGSEWTIDTLTQHFKDLGFTNIRTVPCDPDDDRFDNNIFEMNIATGWFSTDPWKAGDEFKPDAEITIYYNESPKLTIDNCPDLVTVLTSKDMSYTSFCTKYDGRYVEFDAYVIGHLTYDGGTSHIIDVAGGDYDGKTKIDAFDPSTYNGLIIRIGDCTWGNSINESVEVGDHVTVRGRIDLSWAEYYKCMYVETMEMSRR